MFGFYPASKLPGVLWRLGGTRKESLQLSLGNLNQSASKSRCEMLIGGDDISNDDITLGTCFSMFVPFALVSAPR